MYLSKIVLHWPSCRNPYQWHRLIWRLFDNPDGKRDFQFACLERRPGKNVTIILFSLQKPVLLRAEDVHCIGEPKNIESLSFKANQRLRFRLTANPTKIVTEQTDAKRKIRVPLIKPDQQEAWLKKHLNECAEIESCSLQNEPPLYFYRKNMGGKILPVQFEGLLRVVNPDKLKEQIYHKFDKDGRYIAGLGPAKSFGCGLLLLKPI